MSTDFAATDTQNPLALIAGMQKFADKTFDEVASATKFLPRLQLFSSNSAEVKEGKILQGHYGTVTMKGQPVIDLTDSVDVLLIVWRPKALDMSGETVTSCFNVEDANFRDIAAKSDDTDSGCMFGPEFLCWIPSISKFATFFCGSKTARREAVNIKGLCGKPATLKAHLIRKGKYIWHGPRVFECSVPFEMPDIDELKDRVNAFNNPPEIEVEEDDVAGDDRVR